jgi:hypothetical protein
MSGCALISSGTRSTDKDSTADVMRAKRSEQSCACIFMGGNMNLVTAIETFNKSNQAHVTLKSTRDGRITALLPRVDREIMVQGSTLNKDVKLTSSDIAWLCEEARLGVASSIALLAAAVTALRHIEQK